MKEVAELLKKLGPGYILTWEWSFDPIYPTMRMILTYYGVAGIKFTHEQRFPANILDMENGVFGAQVLDRMYYGIIEKKKEYWGEK